MKFIIKREQLLPALQSVNAVIERRQNLFVLVNLLLRVGDGQINLVGTDMEVELSVAVPGDFPEAGDSTLPARKLLDICRALPEQADINFSISGDRAVISSGKSRFTLVTLPAKEFPRIEPTDSDIELKLVQSEFKALLDKTAFAMAQQDVRYYLNGMLLEVEYGRLRAVATDGHRLAMAEMQAAIDVPAARQLIVPRKGVLELSRLLTASDAEACVSLSQNHIRITLENQVFTSKLIDGKFPDYKRVIPEQSTTPVVADRELLRQSLTRASILSNEKYHGVRIELAKDKLMALAHNPEQEEAEEEMQVDYSGPELDIGFNVSYLLDAISIIKGDKIVLGIPDPNSSCLLLAENDDSCRYVVMPMRL